VPKQPINNKNQTLTTAIIQQAGAIATAQQRDQTTELVITRPTRHKKGRGQLRDKYNIQVWLQYRQHKPTGKISSH